MDLDQTQALPGVAAQGSRQTEPHLEAGWLVLARSTWLVIVTLALLLFAINIPLYLRLLQTVCPLRSSCPSWQPTIGMASALQHLGFSLSDYAAFNVVLMTVSALLWVGIGFFVFWRKSNEWITLIFALHAITQGINGPNGYLDSLQLSHSIWQLPATCMNILNLSMLWLVIALFPNGRFAPRWMRWLLPTFITFYLILSIFFIPNLLHSGPLGGLFFFLTTGGLFGGQIYRYLRVSSLIERQQTKWVIFSLAIVLIVQIGVVIPSVFSPLIRQPGSPYIIIIQAVDILILLIVPPAIAIALFRYRLWDIDLIINRALVYGTLTVCVVALYVLVVVGLGALLQTSGNLLISLMATGLVAALFQPLRGRLQGWVNRLMFGERDAPYTVISRLGKRLEATVAPDAVLPTIVETVAQALKLPYAAITLKYGDEFTLVASQGTAQRGLVYLPLLSQAEIVGEIILAPRSPGEKFTPADRRLLGDLARQAGAVAHAVRLTEDLKHLTRDLQRTREQLVSAREEERRRLRRDLHDGLGPQLASLTLKLETARNKLAYDPLADSLLADLTSRTQTAVADIRHLVYALRPPALDELGLVSALWEQALQYSQQGQSPLLITCEVPESLPPLSAAVEVAIYRIAQEALTNVVRHAQANQCHLRLALDEAAGMLSLEIQDNGRGLSPTHHQGVGLTSMRERAEELGGTWTIEAVSTGGTRILVQFTSLSSRTRDATDRQPLSLTEEEN